MRNAETTAREAAKAMRDFAKLLKKTIENKMNKQIFKNGDKVYHYRWGWGEFNSYMKQRDRCVVNFHKDEPDSGTFLNINELSFTEYDLINGGLSHERPFKLEVGKSYTNTMIENSIIINRKGAHGNYGWWGGNWSDSLMCGSNQWDEATDEEVKEALLKETIKRFGKNWRDAKIKHSAYTGMQCSNNRNKTPDIVDGEGWEVWNRNGCLFYKGKWAEKLEEPEFKPFQRVLVRDVSSNPWKLNLFSHFAQRGRLSVCMYLWGLGKLHPIRRK